MRYPDHNGKPWQGQSSALLHVFLRKEARRQAGNLVENRFRGGIQDVVELEQFLALRFVESRTSRDR
jgi:hypothetical protein